MDFSNQEWPDDGTAVMRERVLTDLMNFNRATDSGELIDGRYDWRFDEFSVERTVERKGYRHEGSWADPEYNARYGNEMTKITIVLEVPDAAFPDLVQDVTALAVDNALKRARADADKAATNAAVAADAQQHHLNRIAKLEALKNPQ